MTKIKKKIKPSKKKKNTKFLKNNFNENLNKKIAR